MSSGERLHQPQSQNFLPITSSRVNPQASKQSRLASISVPSSVMMPAKYEPCSKKVRNLALASAKFASVAWVPELRCAVCSPVVSWRVRFMGSRFDGRSNRCAAELVGTIIILCALCGGHRFGASRDSVATDEQYKCCPCNFDVR